MLARNTVFNLVGQVVPLLVGVAATPYTIRHLGPDRFGILSLAWIIVGYFALFDLGIGPATTKFVAELLGKGQTQDLPALVWTALATQSGFGLLAGLLLAAASPALVHRVLKIPPGLHADALWVFVTLAVSFPINFATGSLRGVLAASQRFDLLNAIGIPSTALYYLIPVVALALGFRLPAIALFLVLSRAAVLAASALLCLRLYPALAHGCPLTRSLIRHLLGYGGWVTVSAAVGPILLYVDRLLIGALLSVGALAYYTPAFMIASKLSILPASLAATLLPAFSSFAGRQDGPSIEKALVRSLKYLLLLTGPPVLVVALFARRILVLWLGTEFARNSASVLQIVALGTFIGSLAYVPSALLQGVGRPDLTAKFNLFELPLHVGLAWLLITKFGLAGAALAWGARFGIDLFLVLVAAFLVSRVSLHSLLEKHLLRSVLGLAGLSGGLAAFVAWSHALFAQASLMLFLTVVFAIWAWRYSLDFEEKGTLRLLLKERR